MIGTKVEMIEILMNNLLLYPLYHWHWEGTTANITKAEPKASPYIWNRTVLLGLDADGTMRGPVECGIGYWMDGRQSGVKQGKRNRRKDAIISVSSCDEL